MVLSQLSKSYSTSLLAFWAVPKWKHMDPAEMQKQPMGAENLNDAF